MKAIRYILGYGLLLTPTACATVGLVNLVGLWSIAEISYMVLFVWAATFSGIYLTRK